MTEIKILIYTDHTHVSANDSGGHKGVSTLIGLLDRWKPAFAELKPRVVNRFQNPQMPEKLTSDFLKDFDEIWFFGLHQANVDQVYNEDSGGGRENELDPEQEVKPLRRWMSVGDEKGMIGGGVLIAGDHSEIDFNNFSTNVDTFLCRGRAVGEAVPRAGQLRKWRGSPTNGSASSNNNVVDSRKNSGTQNDVFPQTLDLGASPHPLFLGRRRTINIFPDHEHEGELLIPNPLDGDWPTVNGLQPGPVIVAHGQKLPANLAYPAVTVYDGDPVNGGRIVADTSWHHYMNINLENLSAEDDDADLNLMGQFFSNLAVWLAPLKIRQEMSRNMFEWLARHPEVSEERGNADEVIGAAALRYLPRVATQCEVHELLRAVSPVAPTPDAGPLAFTPLEAQPGPFPTQALALGSVITEFHWAALPAGVADTVGRKVAVTTEGLIETGMSNAFRLHAEKLGRIIGLAQSNVQSLTDALDVENG
jgi:hypothetical protein